MSFTTSSKNTPCPICGNTDGRCRHHHEENKHLCMVFADVCKGEIVSGYKCTGHTKDSTWAMFALDNSQEWTQAQRDEWERLKQQGQRDREQLEARKRSDALSIHERDRLYRELLDSLTLDPRDEHELLQRGLRSKEIIRAGFKSVSRGQKLSKHFDPRLPGVSTDGTRLLVDDGYLCPVRNIDGLIVACQIRLRNASEGGRYRWLSSASVGGHSPHLCANDIDKSTILNNRVQWRGLLIDPVHAGKLTEYPSIWAADLDQLLPSHKPDTNWNELPISVHYPQRFKEMWGDKYGAVETIAFVEGVGVKPLYAAEEHNWITIGASGGQWTSSPNLLWEVLRKLQPGINKEIILVPDAGDACNRSVIYRWRNVCEFLSSLGFENVKFYWWGQIDKRFPDIDERWGSLVCHLKQGLAPEVDIENDFLTPSEFFAIADSELSKATKGKQQQEKAIDAGLELPETPKSEKQAGKLTQPNDDWKAEYEAKRAERAKFKFTRKADIQVSEGYLPSVSLGSLPRGVVGLKADWGCGKSFLTANLVKNWEGRVIQLAHLNAILHNTAPKYGLMHHHDIKHLNLSLTSVALLAITDVSLAAKLDPEHWCKGEPFILIWDEIVQGLKSLHTSSNLGGRLRIKARVKIEWLIRNAEYIIAADRDLDDETLEYLEHVRGNGKAFIIQHTGKKGKGRKPITLNSNKHKDEVLSQLISDAKSGLKCAIACETKSDLLAIEGQLRDAGIDESKMFFAHGDNSNETHVKPVIEKIDSSYTDYQVLGYTMTMGTAISLEIPHFDRVYAFFTGDVLAATDQCQMLFRYRQICDITVWVNPKRRTLEIEPSNLLNNLQLKLDATNSLIASVGAIGELCEQGFLPTARGAITPDDMPFLQHKLSILARLNASRSNPFQSLYDELSGAGFTIDLEKSDDEEEDVRTTDGLIHGDKKKEIKEEGDRLIAEAELMSDVEFEAAKINAGSLKKSERDRLAKTRLHRDTGLEITQPIVRLQRTKKLVQGARMLKVLLGTEADAIAHDLVDRERNPDVNDQNFYTAKRRLLCELGTPELISKLTDGWNYTSDSPEIQEFAENARNRKKDVKRLLGFNISTEKTSKGTFKMSNAQILGNVLNLLCIERTSNKERKQGNTYALNTEHWEMLQKVICHMNNQEHNPKLQDLLAKIKASVEAAEASQSPEDEWLTTENIELTAEYLQYCESPEALQGLRTFVPVAALKKAAASLSSDVRARIARWVKELNQQNQEVVAAW